MKLFQVNFALCSWSWLVKKVMRCNFCWTAEPGGWHGNLQLALIGSELLVAQRSLGLASLASGLWAGSRAMLSCCHHVQLRVTPWTVSRQTPLSVGFSRQEYWSVLPCHLAGALPDPGIKPASSVSPELAGSLPPSLPVSDLWLPFQGLGDTTALSSLPGARWGCRGRSRRSPGVCLCGESLWVQV